MPWTRNSESNDLEPEAGTCAASEEGGGDTVFIAEYCPTPYSPMVLIGLCLYLISFQSGLGPVPWIVNAEVHVASRITLYIYYLHNYDTGNTYMILF